MNDDLAKLVTLAVSTKTFTDNPWDRKQIVNEIEQRSGISRRTFLGGLLVAAAATAITAKMDPEKLLWTPAQKTIFVPPTNTEIITISEFDMDLVAEFMGMPLGEEARLLNRTAIGMFSDEEFKMMLDQSRLQKKANAGLAMYPAYPVNEYGNSTDPRLRLPTLDGDMRTMKERWPDRFGRNA